MQFIHILNQRNSQNFTHTHTVSHILAEKSIIMLSIMWGKKKRDFSEKSIILEKLANTNYLNENIKSEDDGFLNSCYLCHKHLSLGKEIFMYRGEMGFCSVDCRNKQMYLDDMKKIEVSTRRILASFHERRRHGGGRCESRGGGRVVSAAAPPPIFISK